jgi:hypothetical protein
MDSLAEAKIKGKVTLNGRTFFAVASKSRPGHWHLSRRDQCSCEAFYYGHKCSHQDLCICVRCLGEGRLDGDPEEGCYFCEGSGDAR